jgi:hypothetical protein
MESPRSPAAAMACWLTIGLCVFVSGIQLYRITGHLITWQRRQEPVPAFGGVDVVYFYEPTCPACQIASPAVLELRRRYPRYRIARVDTSSSAGIALQEEYSNAYGVPARDRDRIPTAFAGHRYFVGADAITVDLTAYLRTAVLTRPSPHLLPHEQGRAILAQRFRSLGAAPVLVAGLVDSINPCSIATMVFFISFLTWAGRQPRDLLWIGGFFTLGVFVTYFLIGLGLLQAMHSLRAVPLLGRLLYPAAAIVTLLLALISFLDYRRARQGQTGQIALQLPRRLKLRIHQAIRAQLGVRHLALAALVTSVFVSAVEFTCTSQVYLPTLMYMAQAGNHRLRATFLLLLYNLMFVLPLIAFFTAAYFGVSARTMAKLATRHAATAKLAMCLLFIGFTVYLCTISVRMFVPG